MWILIISKGENNSCLYLTRSKKRSRIIDGGRTVKTVRWLFINTWLFYCQLLFPRYTALPHRDLCVTRSILLFCYHNRSMSCCRGPLTQLNPILLSPFSHSPNSHASAYLLTLGSTGALAAPVFITPAGTFFETMSSLAGVAVIASLLLAILMPVSAAAKDRAQVHP